MSQVHFATTAFYLCCLNTEKYRYFFLFVNHIKECPTCIKGINEYRTVCPTGFHLGKKVLVYVYKEYGEIYSTYNRDVNNEIVWLELDNTITNIQRIVQMLEVKVMYNISYMYISRHDLPKQKPPSLLVESRYSERVYKYKKCTIC